MAACILVFSPRCQHSRDTLAFLQAYPQLRQIVQLHDVSVSGIPPQYARYITRVPTLLTKDGKILVGNEIRAWFSSLMPTSITNKAIGGAKSGKLSSLTSLDGSDGSASLFNLNDYGKSLQPAITPEMQARINQKVG